MLDFLKPKSPLEKAANMIREPYAQSDARREAMDKLLAMGTDEAYAALLKRFTINANGQIADESEKRDLVEHLVSNGEQAMPALEKFIREEKKHLAFPLRAAARILDHSAAVALFEDVLTGYEPLDHRSVHAKVNLVITLGEMVGPEKADVFVPYLDDHDDDVQFKALDVLQQLANPDTREAIAKVCISELHANRVKRRAAQVLSDLEWSAKAEYAKFDDELKGEYLLGKKGVLVKKGTDESA